MTTETISPALPAAPRPMTPRVRRRAWGEAPVRVWMILTLLIGISLASLVARDVSDAVAEEHLMRDGSQAQAVITEIDGTTDPRKTVVTHSGTSDRTVTIKYPDASGEPVENTRELETSRFEGKRVGEAIDIRYNPAHPEEWTDRTEPQPWIARLAIAWMLLPALLIAVAMMILRRRQVLRIWRDGVPAQGTIVDIRQSPIAPRSRVVRFTFDSGEGNRRIFSTLYPNSAAAVNAGDELVMLALPGDRSRAIVAGLYEELNH